MSNAAHTDDWEQRMDDVTRMLLKFSAACRERRKAGILSERESRLRGQSCDQHTEIPVHREAS